ncbi:MAG: hypothetical protein HY707_02890 [Ignavibacteriae bacterium]|nr:hypothetical protein [Ignavibacteriota bacterium]
MKRFMFVMLIVLAAGGINSVLAQVQQAIYPFEVSVLTAALEVGEGGFSVEGLAPGTCYDIPADPLGDGTYINPLKTGEEAYTNDGATITGDPGADVQVSISVPTLLGGAALEAPPLSLSYDGTSAAWGPDGGPFVFFNPQSGPQVVNLFSGEILVWVSPDICTPTNLLEEITYEGQAIVTAQYITPTP